ncbi:hypothetical protein ACWEN6_13655 [Sphaerisporangium sp. NPDC004334]
MHWHTTDYRDDHPKSALFNRGFWASDLPRLIVLCRIFGHRPVVDGHGTPGERRGQVARWVTCDRCGVRPDPQGNLDPEQWNVGDRYTEPIPKATAAARYVSAVITQLDQWSPERRRYAFYEPGPWEAHPKGTIGGQLVVGKTVCGLSLEVKVGNAGSEHVLAGHVSLSPFGALYLHTERFGTWLQRRLNPIGYSSRVIGVSVHDWRLYWSLWARRGEWSKTDPWWMQGSVNLDLVELLFGPKRYSYEDVEAGTGIVRMPEGDAHEVGLRLQRVRFGRPKTRRPQMSWSVEWEAKPGIPFRRDSWKGDSIFSSSVQVSDAAVDGDRWVSDACAAIALAMSKQRTRYGYRPPAPDLEH